MSLSAPPMGVVRTVEMWAPGIYNEFLSRLFWGVRNHSVMATSWYRAPDWNRSVGGSPESQHLVALAVDLTPYDSALAASLQSSGLVVVPEGSHLHVQTWPAGVLGASGMLRALGI